MRKFAIIMQLPDGKLPGFYAQVIKALANNAHIFDRHKEILIIENLSELMPIEQILSQYKIQWELVPLIHAPMNTILKTHYEDFGFTTNSDHTFLYEQSLILFSLEHDDQNSEDYRMALMQLDEHLIASFAAENTIYYIAENHLKDCFYGIAKAYDCTFVIHDL